MFNFVSVGRKGGGVYVYLFVCACVCVEVGGGLTKLEFVLLFPSPVVPSLYFFFFQNCMKTIWDYGDWRLLNQPYKIVRRHRQRPN